jgi:hypothetical protein
LRRQLCEFGAHQTIAKAACAAVLGSGTLLIK